MGNTDKNEAPTERPNDPPADLLSLIQAYNRHEISLEEWLRLTKQWAEEIVRRHDNEGEQDRPA